MTEQEQRIAIAEACGKHVVDVPFTPCLIDVTRSYLTDTAYKEYRKVYPSGSIPMRVPDYLHDLNAMHEAEKVLQDKCLYWPNYIDELSKLFRCGFPDTDATNWSQMCHATAAQRAEAFCRTLGIPQVRSENRNEHLTI